MKLQDFDFRIWSAIDNTYLHNPSLTITHFKSAVYKNAYSMEVGEVIDENKDEREVLIGCLDNNRYKSVEIELWTGLVDVNGVKLYDGDIFIVFGDEKYRAVCNIKEFYGKPLSERNVKLPLSIINPKKPKEWKLEVIGNIHENAELLKGQE